MNSEILDAELDQGLISAETLNQFIAAESYGAASPMKWLEKRLRIMEGTLRSGRSLIITNADGEEITLSGWPQYEAWCARVLPNAYSCFVKERETVDKSAASLWEWLYGRK